MADLSPSPRPSLTSMSSNTSRPQPQLIRRTSEGSAHRDHSTQILSTPSSIPSFRAIRNLFPFGPSKPASPAQPPTQIKHPFHFGSLRRSSDRKPSPSSLRDRQPEQDNPPVISIARLDTEEFGVHQWAYNLPSDTPVHPSPADLSTILEADNSGISKHIPSPSPSPSPTSPQSIFSSKDTFLPPPSQRTFTSPKISFPHSEGYPHPSSHPSRSTSNLDLSKLSAELHHALSPTNASGWLNSIVVEDADIPSSPPLIPRALNHGSDSRDTTSGLPKDLDPDATFNFSALDPDLADLLSPHRASSKNKVGSSIETSSSTLGSPPIPHPTSPIHRSKTPLSSGLPSTEPPLREPTAPLSPEIRTPAVSHSQPKTPDPRSLLSSGSRLPRGTVRTPDNTSMLHSLSRPSLTVRRPPSHLPRLMRSVTSASPLPIAGPGETATRIHRRQPSSPLSSGLVPTDTPMRSSSDTIVDEPSSLSGCDDRSGPSNRLNVNGARRFGLNGVRYGGDQIFRPRSAEEGSRGGHRIVNSTPGDTIPVSSPLARGPGPPTMEWLGPRTVKAFAAAGLFDGEQQQKQQQQQQGREESGCARYERERKRAGSVSRFEKEREREGASSVLSRYERDGATSVMSSRFGRDRELSLGSRYGGDRDHSSIHHYVSLRDHAPSRAAFSEAASTSSMGARSACTAGNAGAGWSPSPTFSSVARTAFSGSTAPTSVSSGVGSGVGAGGGVGVGNAMGVNNGAGGPNGALRILQEKHYFETSALLGALADSQDACRRLREENSVLRERVMSLEAIVNEGREVAGLGADIGSGSGSGPDEIEKGHACDRHQDFARFPRPDMVSLRVSPIHQPQTLKPHPRLLHHHHNNETPFDFATFRRSPSPSRYSASRPVSPSSTSRFTQARERAPSPQKRDGYGVAPSSLSSSFSSSPHKRQIQLQIQLQKQQRRASTTSSLFPAPPPEMSMLMLEDVELCAGGGGGSSGAASGSGSESPPSPGVGCVSLSSSGARHFGYSGRSHSGHSHSHSLSGHSHTLYGAGTQVGGGFSSFGGSSGMVAPSPSTATFSMTEVPGSPHSLQLRPEHELHLGDMASLSLYAMSDGEEGEGEGELEDGWKDGV